MAAATPRLADDSLPDRAATAAPSGLTDPGRGWCRRPQGTEPRWRRPHRGLRTTPCQAEPPSGLTDPGRGWCRRPQGTEPRSPAVGRGSGDCQPRSPAVGRGSGGGRASANRGRRRWGRGPASANRGRAGSGRAGSGWLGRLGQRSGRVEASVGRRHWRCGYRRVCSSVQRLRAARKACGMSGRRAWDFVLACGWQKGPAQ